MPIIKVRSKVSAFRRAGLQFTAEGEEFDTKNFTPAQLEAIAGEPMLIVEMVSNSGAGKSTAGRRGASISTNTNTNSGADEVVRLLDGSIENIVEVITARDVTGAVMVSDDTLATILTAEENDKARKTLLAAIKEEQLRRLDSTQGR